MSSQAAGSRSASAATAPGAADGAGAYFLLLADHWSPILALLAPLYWIYDSPADSRTAEALAHPLPAARLHTNIYY